MPVSLPRLLPRALRRAVVLSLSGLVLLALTSAKLTGLVLLLVPAVIVPIIVLGRRLRTLSRENQDWIAASSGNASEALSAAQTVQAFTHEAQSIAAFDRVTEKSFDVALIRIATRAVLTVVIIALVFFGVVGVLWVGALDVREGTMSIGELVQFVIYAVLVAGAVGALSEIWGELQRAAGATEVVEFARDTAVEVREEATATETVREMRLANGLLYVTEDLERRVTYRIEGAPQAERDITIDHPRQSDWTVSSTTGAEERPDAWRWVIAVGAGERASLTVTERQPRQRRVGLMDIDMNTLAFWEGRAIDDTVRATLRSLATLRTQITEAEAEQRRLGAEAQLLEREQSRLVNLIVQLGDDSQANRERRARVDAIDAEIARAQAGTTAQAERITDLHRQIAALIGA